MVRFEHDHVRSPEVVADRIGDVAQVRGDAELAVLPPDAEPDRINRVVRDRESLDVEILDRESVACLEVDNFRLGRPSPQDSLRQPRHIDSDARPSGQDGEALDVIRVLVGNHDRVKSLEVLPYRCQAELDLAAAKACIEQNPHPARRDECRVSPRAAS